MSDLIERQAAIDLINDIDLINFTAKGVIRGRLQKLPSAKPEIKCIAKVTLTDEQVKEAFEKAKNEILAVLPPERKTGHWEDVPHKSVEHGEVVVDGETVRCSVCRCAEKGWNKGMNYCPECGAKMEAKNET